MRVEPYKKIVNERGKTELEEKTEKVARKVAIFIAFISTFLFFFKILFF